jgi:PTH1 family peptidyl-tRNA hydrolase
VYDDLDLPFGRIRIRPSGGAGGHRGLLSIIESLGGAPFCRVRFGVGRPPQDMEAENYVLAPFSTDESSELGEKIDRVAAAVTSIVRDGIKRAMEQFNRAL